MYDEGLQSLDERYLLGPLPDWLKLANYKPYPPLLTWTQCSVDEVVPGYTSELGTGCGPCYLPCHVVVALGAPLQLELVQPGVQVRLTLPGRGKLLLADRHQASWQYRITGSQSCPGDSGRCAVLTFRVPCAVLPAPDQPCLFDRMPPEIIHLCLEHLRAWDLRSAKQTSKLLREIATPLLRRRVLTEWTAYSSYPCLDSGTRFIYVDKLSLTVEMLPLVEFSLDRRGDPSHLVFADGTRRLVFGQCAPSGASLLLQHDGSTVPSFLIQGQWQPSGTAAEPVYYPHIICCCRPTGSSRCYCGNPIFTNDGCRSFLVCGASQVGQCVRDLVRFAQNWQTNGRRQQQMEYPGSPSGPDPPPAKRPRLE